MAVSAPSSRGEFAPQDLTQAFDLEARRGALLAIAACGLWVLFNILSLAVDLSTGNPNPAFARYPPSWIAGGLLFGLASIPIYLVARRSRRPLAWCFVAMMTDLLLLSQLKFFWIWPSIDAHQVPLFIEVRYQDFQAFLMLLVIYSLTLSRTLVLFGGLAIGVVWVAGIIRSFAVYPSGVLIWGRFGHGPADAGLDRLMEPDVLSGDFLIA